MKFNRKSPLFPAALILALVARGLQAAVLTWDAGNTTNGATIDALGGNWNTAPANSVWNDAGNNVIWSQTNTTVASNSAVFGGVDGAVDSFVVILPSQMATSALTFNNTGYKITGSTVYLVGGVVVAPNKSATINSILSSSNAVRAVTINSGSLLNLSGGFTAGQFQFGGSGTLNITGGTSSPAVAQFNNAAVNQTGGTVNLTGASSAGNWIGYNPGQNVTYTINGGTLALNGTASGAYLSLGWQTNVARKGTLVVQTGGTVDIGTTASKFGNLYISQTSDSSGRLDVQGGTVTIGTSDPLNQIIFFQAGSTAGYTATMTQSGGTVTANGIQFGGGSGAYAGSGATLQLSGGNLYVGALGITRGSAAATLPVNIQLQGGTLGASQNWFSSMGLKLGATATSATIQAANSGAVARDITLSGILSDDISLGTFTKTGVGSLILSGNNIYTGGTSVIAGALVFANINAKPVSGTHAFSAGTILGLGVSNSNPLFFNSADIDHAFAGIMTGNLSNVTLSSATYVGIDTSAGDFTYTVPGSPTRGLVKLGTNTLTLAAPNSYTGGTLVFAGILKLALGDDRLPVATQLSIGSGTNFAEFDLNGRSQQVAGLAITTAAIAANQSINNSSVTPSTLTVNAATPTSFAGILKGNLILAKSGSDTLSLTGANTYSGNTTVSEGTLAIGVANPSNESSTVAIAATGATLNLTYSGTDTVNKLFIGATQLAAGEYGALGSILPIIGISQIIGTGTLTVLTGGNTAPTITDITDQSVPSGGFTGALAFTVGDAQTAAGSLTVTGSSSNTTLVPNANIAFGGSGANRTVTVTPVSGLSGSAIITITVTDTGSPAFSNTPDENFLISVTDNYLSWSTANGVTGGANGDADDDGVKNLAEYALVDGGEHGVFTGNTITFTKRGAPYGSDLTYNIESSTLLTDGSWTTLAKPPVVESASLISYTFTPSTPVKKFARLKVIQIP